MGVGEFENCTRKDCFLSFEREKTNFTTFAHPLEKFLENSTSGPLPEKHLSDAHE